MSLSDRLISRENSHPILTRRTARNWSQAELARRAGISRAAVSAIEGARLTPSVAAALSLAAALECSVEELFGGSKVSARPGPEWAWGPGAEPCRYWEAEVNQRRWVYPVEASSVNPIPHDGIWDGVFRRDVGQETAERTLTLASCDPAAGLLATEYARASGFRLLVFPRGGTAALKLVGEHVVHVAGLHRATSEHPGRNVDSVRSELGSGHRLLRAARWEEGIALPPGDRTRSAEALMGHSCRWAAREEGSAARECLDELLAGRRLTGRVVNGHTAVAEAVHSGWAGAGVCVRFSAQEAGLNFIPIRTEALDFCFSEKLQHDPRIQALVRLLRSREHRRMMSELPGYDARETGELTTV